MYIIPTYSQYLCKTKYTNEKICLFSVNTMADYQYGLSSISDNYILHQIITKRRKMCESIIDDPPSEYILYESLSFEY